MNSLPFYASVSRIWIMRSNLIFLGLFVAERYSRLIIRETSMKRKKSQLQKQITAPWAYPCSEYYAYYVCSCTYTGIQFWNGYYISELWNLCYVQLRVKCQNELFVNSFINCCSTLFIVVILPSTALATKFFILGATPTTPPRTFLTFEDLQMLPRMRSATLLPRDGPSSLIYFSLTLLYQNTTWVKSPSAMMMKKRKLRKPKTLLFRIVSEESYSVTESTIKYLR